MEDMQTQSEEQGGNRKFMEGAPLPQLASPADASRSVISSQSFVTIERKAVAATVIQAVAANNLRANERWPSQPTGALTLDTVCSWQHLPDTAAHHQHFPPQIELLLWAQRLCWAATAEMPLKVLAVTTSHTLAIDRQSTTMRWRLQQPPEKLRLRRKLRRSMCRSEHAERAVPCSTFMLQLCPACPALFGMPFA